MRNGPSDAWLILRFADDVSIRPEPEGADWITPGTQETEQSQISTIFSVRSIHLPQKNNQRSSNLEPPVHRPINRSPALVREDDRSNYSGVRVESRVVRNLPTVRTRSSGMTGFAMYR